MEDTTDNANIFNEQAASFANKFGWPEYAVFATVLAMSAAIGIFYGCFGSKQSSNEEYLMGNRNMSSFPVALSLLCSFISAIALLGLPSEIYLYGAQCVISMITFIPLTLVLFYLYVPVYFNLQLTCAYEYFELRFNRPLRMIISVISIIYFLMYMSIVVYGPSLALNQVTGLDRRMLCAATFLVCIFYSTLGGFKTVLWTDVLQCLIMMGSLVVVAVKGVNDIGGVGVMLERLEHGGRLNMLNFDVDMRTRHTVWTSVIGVFILWLQIYAATQPNIQRYISMPNMKTVRNALLLNLLGLHVIVGLSYTSGLAIYAKYHGCDPIARKGVSSPDQMLPYFVMDILGDMPGMPGVFVAGLTCASLSTVSSSLNALAAIITEDYIKKWKPNLSDSKLSTISKIICVTSGFISFGFLFLTEHMGNILPASMSLMGVLMAPTLGLFTLGMFFPWANSKGTIAGLILSFIIMILIAVGRIVFLSLGLLPNQKLPLSVDGCLTDHSIVFNSTSFPDWKNRPDDTVLVKILSMSYNWLPVLAVIFVIVFGLLFSVVFRIIGLADKHKVSSKCLSPPILWMWTKLLPEHMVDLVNHDMYDFCKPKH